jgi:hypothetical protein
MYSKKLSKNRKGQGLSLTVIIVAALALVVMVVLIAIFTGRFAIFQKQVGGEAKAELQAMQAFYGRCQPDSGTEATFLASYTTGTKLDDLQEAAQAQGDAKDAFQEQISTCSGYSDDSSCSDDDSCKWSKR